MNQMPEIVRETGSHVTFRVKGGYGKDTRKERKFRCIGGPLDGGFTTSTQAYHFPPLDGFRYRMFNNAGSSRYSAIFAWLDG